MKRSKMLVIAVLIIAIVTANCNVTTAQAATSSTTSSFVQMLYKKYFGKVMPTATPKPTATPIPTATSTPVPTATSTPVPTATSTPKPTATSTPVPTATSTPKPTATSTPVPTATSTPKPTATSTPVPTATSTPVPTATSTPVPTATSTPVPTATSTPVPTATSTPVPTATSTPVPTATPIVYATNNIMYYGATGNGITDDTAAIKAALSANKGGSIYIPSGTYIVSSHLTVYSNTSIYGDGASSIIMAKAGMSIGSTIFYTQYTTNISLSNFTVSGNSIENTRDDGYSGIDGIHLFDIWYSNGVSITNCSFIDNIYVAIRSIGSSNISVTYSNFTNVDCGFITLGSTALSDITISGCNFIGHEYSEPVSFYANATHTNIVVTNNIMSNKLNGCAILFSANGTYTNITVTGNQINNTATGISISNATTGTVSNNILSNMLKGNGIALKNSSDFTVADNSISNTYHNGLLFDTCSNIKIYNNNISGYGLYNQDYYGIRISGANASVEIYNNVIEKTIASNSINGVLVTGYGVINIYDNTYVSCRVFLYSTSSGVSVEVESNTIDCIYDSGISNTVYTS